jgi:hypothetical protein
MSIKLLTKIVFLINSEKQKINIYFYERKKSKKILIVCQLIILKSMPF